MCVVRLLVEDTYCTLSLLLFLFSVPNLAVASTFSLQVLYDSCITVMCGLVVVGVVLESFYLPHHVDI